MSREELLQAVVNNLSGRSVTLRFVEPYPGSDGTAYIRDGKCFIDIKPGFDDKTLLYVLCHESAHVRSGDVPDVTGWSLGALASDKVSIAVGKVLSREARAEEQARAWLKYAEYFKGNYAAESWLDSRLKALEAWYPGSRSKYGGEL